MTHPAVENAQLVGIPSKLYGEEAVACILLKKGKAISERELQQVIQDNLAFCKTPKHVLFMDAYPVTALGKVQKFKLQEVVLSMLEKNGSNARNKN